MGPSGSEVTIKKRKVVYDDYTGAFYAESKVESLQRMCDYRARLTDVLNKAEEARYKFACRQVDAEKNLFLMKKEKATHKHVENLHEHKAHMNVLDKLARERLETASDEEDGFGKYPRSSLRNNLDEMIDKELKEMTPIVKRRREATRLLLKRSDLIVPDRTLTTEEMFEELKKRKSRTASPVKSSDMRRSAPQLILPAISVRLNRHGDKTKVTVDTNKTKHKDPSQFPSVFVTDPKSYASAT